MSAIAPDNRYVATLRRPPMPRLAASVIFARLGFTAGPRYIWGIVSVSVKVSDSGA